ncbi:hypothetical protein HanPI659440_Chr10g0401861 [Helianthus annuus]|nr:hypothetical protein HanPI659440_Chr10g0401861 [Helianthus annuus]
MLFSIIDNKTSKWCSNVQSNVKGGSIQMKNIHLPTQSWHKCEPVCFIDDKFKFGYSTLTQITGAINLRNLQSNVKSASIQIRSKFVK